MKVLLMLSLCLAFVACGKKTKHIPMKNKRAVYTTVCNRGYLYGKWSNSSKLYPIYSVYRRYYRIQTRCYWN